MHILPDTSMQNTAKVSSMSPPPDGLSWTAGAGASRYVVSGDVGTSSGTMSMLFFVPQNSQTQTYSDVTRHRW